MTSEKFHINKLEVAIFLQCCQSHIREGQWVLPSSSESFCIWGFVVAVRHDGERSLCWIVFLTLTRTILTKKEKMRALYQCINIHNYSFLCHTSRTKMDKLSNKISHNQTEHKGDLQNKSLAHFCTEIFTCFYAFHSPTHQHGLQQLTAASRNQQCHSPLSSCSQAPDCSTCWVMLCSALEKQQDCWSVLGKVKTTDTRAHNPGLKSTVALVVDLLVQLLCSVSLLHWLQEAQSFFWQLSLQDKSLI